MNKEEVFIDLSKCSEEQIKELALIMMRTKKLHEKAFNYMSKGKTFNHFICLAQTDSKEWTLWNINALFNKTELQYPEFIKLFEGGDGENNGWIKIESEADLPKEKGNYYCYDKDGFITDRTFYPDGLLTEKGEWGEYDSEILEQSDITHYQKMPPQPEPPKF